VFAQARTYKVLSTNRTGTMEKELNAAGETGYRFVAVMGGETAVGGKEVVVMMERVEGDTNKYSYRLLATNRTSTLEKEMNEAAEAGFGVVGQTVFESMFGGKETAAIVERNPADSNRYVYKLLATSRTSTMEVDVEDRGRRGQVRLSPAGDQPHVGARARDACRGRGWLQRGRPDRVQQRVWRRRGGGDSREGSGHGGSL
jgi:hypothetical protein